MLGKVTASQTPDWREQRRSTARRAILQGAWSLADDRGLDGWTMRELADGVGVKASSLYGHFEGKPAILDAMFAEGYRVMDERLATADAALPEGIGQRERLIALLGAWLQFCQENPARYRLMFTSTTPGWQPSADAYAVSQASYEQMAQRLSGAGVTPGAGLDLFTAVMAGMAAQQLANDPGGDRWVRLLPDAVDMILNHFQQRSEEHP